MIHRLWGLLVRAVEQFGQAQSQALGGVPDMAPSNLSDEPWEEERVRFDPADWMEPYVHHQSAPRTWQMEPWSWRAVGQTQCGWGRQRNRENFGVAADLSCIAVTSERAGRGREGQAATWVLEHFMRALTQQWKQVYPCALDWSATCDCWGMHRMLTSLAQVHHGLLKALRHKPDWRGMGVAFAGIHLCGSQAHLAQVGDAQILRWREGQLLTFSPPQSTRLDPATSEAGSLAEQANRLTELSIAQENTWFHATNSALSNSRAALGWGESIAIEAGSVSLAQDDIFVLASRGLCDVLSIPIFRDILAEQQIPLEKRGQRLMDIAVNTRFEHDNLTLVLLQVQHQPRCVSDDTLQHWQQSLEEILFRER